MMKYVFGIMIIMSMICGIFFGNQEALTNAVLEEGVGAIELVVYMTGGMCVWGGIMRIANKAGITEFLARLLRPAARLLFKGLDLNGKAYRAMSMNIIANVLGLGNAATPFGLEAMRELEKEEKCTDAASDNMILFTVLNTASITLVPTTVASLRIMHGSQRPLDILPLILINSALSLGFALTLAKVLNACKGKHKRERNMFK